jgi:hypothetical protein
MHDYDQRHGVVNPNVPKKLTRPSPSVPENDVIKAEYAYDMKAPRKFKPILHEHNIMCG